MGRWARPRERAGLMGVGGAVFVVAVLVAAVVSPLAGELARTLRGQDSPAAVSPPPESVARGDEPRVLSVQVVRPPALPMGGTGPQPPAAGAPAPRVGVGVPRAPQPPTSAAGPVPGPETAYVGRSAPSLVPAPAPDRSGRQADSAESERPTRSKKGSKAAKAPKAEQGHEQDDRARAGADSKQDGAKKQEKPPKDRAKKPGGERDD